MVRNEAEHKESEEERERLLQKLQRQLDQAEDFIRTLEKRLYESEKDQHLLEAIFEYFPGGITIAVAGDDKIRLVSKYSQQLLGWPREVLEGLPLQEYVRKWDVLHLDGVTPATAEELPLVRATQQGQVVTDQEWLIRCRDGRTIRILCNAGPIRNRRGDIIGGVVAWRDITERQRAEEQFREVATLLPAAVYLCDASGLIKWYNARAVELWGRKPDPASTDERFCGSYKNIRSITLTAHSYRTGRRPLLSCCTQASPYTIGSWSSSVPTARASQCWSISRPSKMRRAK